MKDLADAKLNGVLDIGWVLNIFESMEEVFTGLDWKTFCSNNLEKEEDLLLFKRIIQWFPVRGC